MKDKLRNKDTSRKKNSKNKTYNNVKGEQSDGIGRGLRISYSAVGYKI